MEPGATKRLGELLDSAPPRLQSSLTARAKRRKSRLSDAAQTDAGAKQFLHSRRRTCRPKELKLKDGAWPQEVFELVKSVFGICTSFFEREILFHTVAKIAAVLRRNLRKKARKNGEAILKCLVQDYRFRSVASWRPWLLLLLHAGGFGPEAVSLAGGKVAKRFEAPPPETMKDLKKREDFHSKYKRVLEEYRHLPERHIDAINAVKQKWAERLRQDLEFQALEERDGLDELADEVRSTLQGSQKVTVASLGLQRYELANGCKFKEEMRRAEKRKQTQAKAAKALRKCGPDAEIDSESASETAPDCGASFCKATALVANPQLQVVFRVKENLADGAVGHYRIGLRYDTRFDQAILRICRARKWLVRDVTLVAERKKGDFVVQLSDTPAIRGIRRNTVIDMYYTTPPWRKNFVGRARQPVTCSVQEELQRYWLRTRGTEDISVRPQEGVVASEDCLCEASQPEKKRRLRRCCEAASN